jgi:DNA-directed RNA polymerase subunit F
MYKIHLGKMEDNQDSSRLGFDSVWKNAQCLNICEVEQLLRGPFVQSEASATTKPHLQMAYTHAKRFSKLRDPQAQQELRMALEDWEAAMNASSSNNREQSESRLAPFELAQIVNLVPNDVDEAISLIPSLDRFSPVDIAAVLELVSTYMKTGGPVTLAAPLSY